jgi:CPA2 family monovalent cation:H+ antiporter-2
MEIPILKEVVIILGLSVIIILAFQRFKMPSILGFLLTGIIAGPYGLSLINASHEVEILAETGIIFLLFVIGIEFSLKGLVKIRNTVLIGGSLQVGGTILFTFIASRLLGLPTPQAVFMGFLISLSSTAIVLKLLQEQGQMNSPHGRLSLGVLIFQDIVVVPMILLTPLLAGNGGALGPALLLMGGKFLLVMAVLVLLSKYVVPHILKLVVSTRSRELFILTVVVLCFATAWLTSSVGLSLALGAFFAGLIISESDYSHQATANILPFREIFISFFFVSVGMLLDLKLFFNNFLMLIGFAAAVILLKMVVVFLMVLIKRYPLRTAIITALTLFQVGEFAFLLSTIGMRNNLLTHDLYQDFLSISILSMGLTPFLMAYSERIADWILRLTLPEPVRRRLRFIQRKKRTEAVLPDIDALHDHLVIIGFGINGHNVARTARQAKIPYVVIDFDHHVYEAAKADGEPIVFGDASEEVLLHHLHVQQARVVVVAIADAEETRKIITAIRHLSETAHVIVRTRYIREIESTLKIGADEVIPEEFETSIEIFTRVLNRYLVPLDEIQRFTNYIRAHNYEVLCAAGATEKCPPNVQLHIPDMVIAALPVQQDGNRIVGKKISESGIREEFNLNVLAIRRGQRYITHIQPEMTIETDDMLYLFGSPDNIARINKYVLIGA